MICLNSRIRADHVAESILIDHTDGIDYLEQYLLLAHAQAITLEWNVCEPVDT